jgi:hypothetical protein
MHLQNITNILDLQATIVTNFIYGFEKLILHCKDLYKIQTP